MQKNWLISWLGETDHKCAEGSSEGLGPVATAVAHVDFDQVYLLTNYDITRSNRYISWLKSRTTTNVDLIAIDLKNPTNYTEIYTNISELFKNWKLPTNSISLTFHLSPGTPAMAAIWIILAKTRFPAHLIQTYKNTVHSVDFPFNLAADFIPEFFQSQKNLVDSLLQQQNNEGFFSEIIHHSQVMRDQIALAKRMAILDVPVLILGETGTGKELFAKAIHQASDRAEKPFIAINCGAIPPELADSELFGHCKGAFTGASSSRDGHFVAANGGTLLLDEIGDLPPATQVRLLRVLQQGEIVKVGESRPIPVNVRIIAATHRPLLEDIASGTFRADLFYRLAVGVLNLPALRDRHKDVELLISHFMDQINKNMAKALGAERKLLSSQALEILVQYDWPGNIRELYHTLVRAFIYSSSPIIDCDVANKIFLRAHSQPDQALYFHNRPFQEGFSIESVISELAAHYLKNAMQHAHGKKKEAATLLGLGSHQTLSDWLKRHHVGEW